LVAHGMAATNSRSRRLMNSRVRSTTAIRLIRPWWFTQMIPITANETT
jgi:hypothetical protein